MDEFLQTLAKIIEQYSGIVLTIGIISFVSVFVLCLIIFILVFKLMIDEDRNWDKKYRRK